MNDGKLAVNMRIADSNGILLFLFFCIFVSVLPLLVFS